MPPQTLTEPAVLPLTVRLKGCSNFRDLGGYATADGRRVRRGLIYRAAHLGDLTAEDCRTLSALGVRTIIDLRGSNEAAEVPHPIDHLPGIEVLAAGIEPEIGERIRAALDAGRATADVIASFMMEGYRDYPRRGAVALRTLFSAVSDPARRPLVFHCTAGKDRTGFAAALLLWTLGVPWPTVVADYLHTNVVWTGHVGHYTELDPQARAALIEARADYLAAAFAALREHHGEVDSFVETVLALDGTCRARLREELLEG